MPDGERRYVASRLDGPDARFACNWKPVGFWHFQAPQNERVQQLQELTGTQHEDTDVLIATYRNQYTRGWTKSRTGRDLASDAPDAEREGYEDNECGLPKWAQMAHHGFLDTELA